MGAAREEGVKHEQALDWRVLVHESDDVVITR